MRMERRVRKCKIIRDLRIAIRELEKAICSVRRDRFRRARGEIDAALVFIARALERLRKEERRHRRVV
jgi:hypothetical protein